MKENVSKLKIMYDKDLIDNESNSLKMLTFTVQNLGNENIEINDYDPKTPLGFIVENGHVVDYPTIISASNSYLLENVSISELNSGYVFPEIIIENNEEFTVKMLILTSKNQIPNIIPTGKIAGVEEIKLITSIDEEKSGLLNQIFAGNIYVHIIRLVAYTFIALIVFMFILGIIIITIESIEKYNKNKVIKKI